MAKFEKGNKKGYKTLFTSDNQPVNRGRKPRLYTIAKKKYNISHEEYCLSDAMHQERDKQHRRR
mgnify:CR=1 FL=1